MKVTLINPPNVYARKGITLMAFPPIGLAYVAAALEQGGHLVQLIDSVGHFPTTHYRKQFGTRMFEVNGAHLDEIVARIDPDTGLIGITCMFMHHWPMVREIIGLVRLRFPTIPIVVGGEHATGGHEQILIESSANAVVLGEGEATALDLVEHLVRHQSYVGLAGLAWRVGDQVIRGPVRARIADLNQIARPAWHLVPVEVYTRRRMFHGPSLGTTMPIMATRGCPYQCTFCTSPQMWTTTWLARDPKDVVDEMGLYRDLYGANDFQFVDLTAIVKKDWILAFCRELRSRNWPDVKWQLPSGTRSEAIDYEVGRELKASGCAILTYAPESGSVAQLRRIKKKVKIDRLLSSIRDVRRAGLDVECFMILGFPDEKPVDILWSYWLIVQFAFVGVESVALSGYRPVPGTESSARLVAEGKIVWNDDLYMDLTESTSLFGGRSYNPVLGDFQVALIRAVAYTLFFGLAFLVRPWRPLRIIVNLVRGVQSSKLEKALTEILKRIARIRD